MSVYTEAEALLPKFGQEEFLTEMFVAGPPKVRLLYCSSSCSRSRSQSDSSWQLVVVLMVVALVVLTVVVFVLSSNVVTTD